jgi:hypothetical protein
MPKRQPARETVEFQGYVNITLDAQQTKEYKKWRETCGDLLDSMTKYAESGYRVSFAWDAFNKCLQCFLMCTDPTMTQAGYIMVGRGSTAASAFTQAWFKDHYVSQGNWKAFTNARQQDWD